MNSALSFVSSVIRLCAAVMCSSLILRAQQTITPPAGQVGVAYSYQIKSTATPPVVFSATSLPPGLAINASSGLISGTPTAAGISHGTVSIISTVSGFVNSASLVMTILPPAGVPVITSPAAISAAVGVSFSYMATASNGPTSFNIGRLPAGLSANPATGLISGAPTVPGTYDVKLSANNDSGTGSAVDLRITVAAAATAPSIHSASTAVASNSAVFNYQITATNSPTEYFASGLPLGLALNPASGLISGTASVSGIFPVSLAAGNANGISAPFTLTLSVGEIPVISSTTTASGNVSSFFSYGVSATNGPTSFNIGVLPAGLVANTTTGVISGVPTAAGVTSVSLSANNLLGTGAPATVVITINPALGGGGGGGGGVWSGGVGGGVTASVSAPTISAQPVSQTVESGATALLMVSASGSGLNFQWSKNGTPLTSQQSSTLQLVNVRATDAGYYSVRVSNTGGAVESVAAVLTVIDVVPPQITAQPVGAVRSAGGDITFSVVATGSNPLSYQWFRNGVALTGANGSSLVLTGLTKAQEGEYSVIVSNAAGSTASTETRLTVEELSIVGTYIGAFAADGGPIGLIVREDRTGVLLGFATRYKVAMFSRDVKIDNNGRFTVYVRTGDHELPFRISPISAVEGDLAIRGAIADNGTLSGSVSGLNLNFSAPAAVSSGKAASFAGFYRSGSAGSSAQSLALLSPAGEAIVVNLTGNVVDGGIGTVTPGGSLSANTIAKATVTGTVAADLRTITTTVAPVSGAVQLFSGGELDRSEDEKLVNISTRSRTGTARDNLIAGFVVAGSQPKPVLIRAVGPTLSRFGVNGALSAVRLEVLRGNSTVAVGTDWGAAGNNPDELARTAARVGAFALPVGSRDAALLLTLQPGSYTAVVTGQMGATGVALVEVYDATVGLIPKAQRVVNIATRATAGSGDDSLIAGFYVSGNVPKRVLVRGVGPALTQFGVEDALARPLLSILQGSTVIAQNAGLNTSNEAAAIVAAAGQVGAFALPAGSQDAAILVNLAPGAYTAQVSGATGATGVALIEVYELP